MYKETSKLNKIKKNCVSENGMSRMIRGGYTQEQVKQYTRGIENQNEKMIESLPCRCNNSADDSDMFECQRCKIIRLSNENYELRGKITKRRTKIRL